MENKKNQILATIITIVLFVTPLLVFAQTYQPRPPFQVQNVALAIVNANSIEVSWDKAMDQDAGVVIGYKIYYGKTSVQKAEDVYESEQVINGDIQKYTIAGLEAGKTYYFAVTAFDDDGNESATYSQEKNIVLSDNPAQTITNEAQTQTALTALRNTTTQTQTQKNQTITSTSTTQTTTDLASAPAQDLATLTPTENTNTQMSDTPTELTQVTEATAFASQNNTETQLKETPQPTQNTVNLENAKNIMVDKSAINTKKTVLITWTPAQSTTSMITDQVVYIKKGIGEWDNGYSVGATTSSIEITVEQGQNYEVRIVTVDISGSKSSGTTTSFSTALPKSGASDFFLLFLLGGLMTGVFIKSRKTVC